MMKICLLTVVLALCSYLEAQQPYSIVIDEIMADPSPTVHLPAYEWIELKNTSGVMINLHNWRIGDRTGISGPMPAYQLQADSFVIICSSTALSAMNPYGPAIAVTSFPSLDNDNDQLFVLSPGGKAVHGVEYSSGWYQNDLKKAGGWSLEMIDTRLPCMGVNNWIASSGTSGGTPGHANAVDGITTDSIAPSIINAYATDSVSIMLEFDEPVDSLSAATPANYSIDNGNSISSAKTVAPLFNKVELKLGIPLQHHVIYSIKCIRIKDCNNNLVRVDNTILTGRSQVPLAGECIINEMLFNPDAATEDYIEVFNNSNKIVDVAQLFIAGRNNSGSIISIQAFRNGPFYILPGSYIVITENKQALLRSYHVKDPVRILQVSSMPSLPDDAGTAILLNAAGNIVDEVTYSSDWHFSLLADKEGIALERINADQPSNDKFNWHSAASTAGNGTPGYENSQGKRNSTTVTGFSVFPNVISPDNDGHDDVMLISYQMQTNGNVANILVYDAWGRPVRQLVRNDMMGLSGQWSWDGLGDKGQRLPAGIYIVRVETFELNGKVRVFNKAIVLARQL